MRSLLNVIGTAWSWMLWSLRTIGFYGLSIVFWLAYFYAFVWLKPVARTDA
jgi:hypothetical protein